MDETEVRDALWWRVPESITTAIEYDDAERRKLEQAGERARTGNAPQQQVLRGGRNVHNDGADGDSNEESVGPGGVWCQFSDNPYRIPLEQQQRTKV